MRLSTSECSEFEEDVCKLSSSSPNPEACENINVLSRGISKQPWIVIVHGIRWTAGAHQLELLDPSQPSYAKQNSTEGILVFKHF